MFDIATSVASNGAIRTHELEQRPMPEGWVQSRIDGSPITDPNRITEGTYVPVGGYKGSGLSLDHRTAGGPAQPRQLRPRHRDFAAPPASELNVGQFVVALDVSRFLPLDVFKAEIDRHIRDIAASKPLPGVDQVRVPGQGRLERRIEREREWRAALHGAAQAGRRGGEVARRRAAQRADMSAAEQKPSPRGRRSGASRCATIASPASATPASRCRTSAGDRRQPAAVPAVAGEPGRAHSRSPKSPNSSAGSARGAT